MTRRALELDWIFFDLGSTLTDESAFEKYMFDHVFKMIRGSYPNIGRRKFNRTLKNLVETRRLGTQVYRRIISELTHDLTEDEDLQRTVLDDYLNHVSKKYMEMQTPYPEARDVLTKLIQEYSMGLIANQPKEARSCLESLGFAKYLKVIVLSEEVGFTKPDPQIFRYALSKADCKPQKAMMVGDRLDNDVAPAKAIGMRTVRVKRGLMRFQKPLTEMESPDCEITTLRGLLTHCFRR